MTKAQLEEIVGRFLGAAPAIIVAARQHTFNRSCMICGVAQGEQHTENCALWELVAARIDFRRLSESPARLPWPRVAAPDPIQTMAMLERSGDFAPTPELEFTRAATATDEWRLT